mgnify:CR=1 FL=1|tara:strand:+ start:1378 stop:1878 length:501 start_codon:yes stop_codon:yes gene_type:complete
MGKVKELEDEIPEYNPDTHRWDMEKKELIPFTPEELAEIARQKRKADLEKRFKPLIANNVYYVKAFGERVKHVNGGSYGIHYEKEIAEWDRDDLDDFEQKVLKLEAAKKEMDEESERERPMLDRRNEYRKIDELLLEALAEKEENKAGKMEEYLKLRSAIKEKFPK